MGPNNTNTSTQTRSKMPLIIGAIAILAIIALVVFVTVRPWGASGNDSNSAVSTPSLKESFNKLAQTVISGADSGTPDYSVPPANWKIIQVANDASASEQATYAETLKSVHDGFATKLNDYISQHSDQDLATLSSDSATLSDQITASVLYLRAGQFANELRVQATSGASNQDSLDSDDYDNSNRLQALIADEIKIAAGMSDSNANMLTSTLKLYYEETINESGDVILLQTLGNRADTIFKNTVTDLATTLMALDSSIGGGK